MMLPSDLHIHIQLNNSPGTRYAFMFISHTRHSDYVQPEKKILCTGIAKFVRIYMKISFCFGCLISLKLMNYFPPSP